MRSRFRLGIVVGSALVLAVGCASPRPPAPIAAGRPADPGVGGSSRLALARSLVGSAYRYGGATPSGFDCSGLVFFVLGDEGIKVPRTTREQAGSGRWVPLDELGGGDLVFFGEGDGEPDHVGIVVSESGWPLRMIHASSSRGVVETDVFASDYWLRRLRFGRRIASPGRGSTRLGGPEAEGTAIEVPIEQRGGSGTL